MTLVDSKCLATLKAVGLDSVAEMLAKEAEGTGAAHASMTLEFLGDEDEADAKYVAELTVSVRKV